MNKNLKTKITAGILLCNMVAYFSTPVLAYTKDESVYSKLDANGNIYQTTVSDHLKNTEKSEFLKDISDLMNIENVSGNQELNQENNTLTWKAQGDDIYYQGNTQKELPVECKVTYSLDGKKINKEDIAGKTGLVKITLEFTNKEQRKVNINGKTETMYVPFVVGMGTIIDNENNKNIDVTNGKVIDNGNKTMVFGIALPGMQESLGVSKDDLEIPNKIEISMEAKKFEMKEIYCFASPKLIEENDLEVFDNLDKIYEIASQLKNASNQLAKGASELRDGAKKLNNGTYELSTNLYTQISKYEEVRKQLSNKKEIEDKIVKIINAEIKKVAPELEVLAEQEAANVIKENKERIEEKTAETALEYTNIAIEEKLNEIANNKEEIIKFSDELLNKIEKDIKTALDNIEQKEDVKTLEAAIKQAILQDVTNTVKAKTSEVINQQVETMKASVTDPTALLTQTDAAILNASKEKIAKTMIPGIQAQYAEQGITLSDTEAEAKAIEVLNQLVTTVSKNTMDKTLDTVATKAPEMAEKTIQEIATNLNTNEALAKAILDYENKIIAEIKATIGEETLAAMKENIKQEIIEELEKAFKDDKTLQAQIQAYGAKAKAELNATIDDVAEKTAKKLASDLTEELANQIASNLIKKQLNGELTQTELDKELSKYEDLINSKLGEVDNQISTLKEALAQLSNGTTQLANGANKLSEGMNKFDDEAIQKIYNYINGDVKNLEVRVEKLKNLANEYQSFTMIDENASGNVKFIMLIDGINKEEDKKEQVVIPSEIKEEKE